MSNEHATSITSRQKKVLILHVEVPDYWADDLDESAGIWADGEPTAKDRLDVVLEEWMREECGITLVGKPGDKCMNDDFTVAAFTGRIVGAETRDV